jgi:hypothetical protein
MRRARESWQGPPDQLSRRTRQQESRSQTTRSTRHVLALALVSLSNLLGIAPSFPTWEECTKPGMVHLTRPPTLMQPQSLVKTNRWRSTKPADHQVDTPRTGPPTKVRCGSPCLALGGLTWEHLSSSPTSLASQPSPRASSSNGPSQSSSRPGMRLLSNTGTRLCTPSEKL